MLRVLAHGEEAITPVEDGYLHIGGLDMSLSVVVGAGLAVVLVVAYVFQSRRKP